VTENPVPTWTVAGVQTDCRLADLPANREMLLAKLSAAADRGARLVVFPECVLTGYGFTSRSELAACAEPVPGPSVDAVSTRCQRLGVWAVFGLLERAGEKLFNTCVLCGPAGEVHAYRKIHLPCLGADRFTDPGDRPFAVHDLGGLVIGMHICFDASFPESARILSLLGADLLVLPTNWADQAMKMATMVPKVRAFENHVYQLAVNRVGTEAGFHYIGRSSVASHLGDVIAAADHDREETIFADIDPMAARAKKVVHCVGEYEIDRLNWRRPDVYGPLVAAQPTPFVGHQNKG
jgi:5-aminopentanamidase